MLYKSAADWRDAPEKRIMLLGMSGLGKTHISNLLRAEGGWFHYSVDYRIGTRYMGEHIADNFKSEAMKVPLLRELLMSDSVYIQSNITFNNLSPLSTYLGKPGDPEKGGLPWDEYVRRQALHREAETNAMFDTAHFAARAKDLYGYNNFVCDSSGSICEIVDPEDPNDPVLSSLSETLLPVWIEGSDAHTEELIRRFVRAPKPMCYGEDFLHASWSGYLTEKGIPADKVDPDDFIRWTFANALARRQPRYRAIADNWGVTVAADAIARVTSEADMTDLVATALERRG
ncbi:MAG: ATPase [Paracoccaceae bacterium]|nr:ATPase [Paracoccaceae bacterium]